MEILILDVRKSSETRQVTRFLAGARCAVLATAAQPAREALLAAPPPVILDLTGAQSPEVKVLPGFRKLAW